MAMSILSVTCRATMCLKSFIKKHSLLSETLVSRDFNNILVVHFIDNVVNLSCYTVLTGSVIIR